MEELNLSERVTATISLAKKKGFEYSMHITPALFEAWMPFNETFANTACAVISWWLREYKKIVVWVEPHAHWGKFNCIIDASMCENKNNSAGIVVAKEDGEYVDVWLIGIAYALALLPEKE